MENEKTIIAPVVTVDELIRSHINSFGKMILNEAEATLLLIELWKFIFPDNDPINEKH